MKNRVLLLLTLVCISARADHEQPPVALPPTLTCVEAFLVFGSADRSPSKLVITQLNEIANDEESGPYSEDTVNSNYGRVIQKSDDDKVLVSFSDGDQVEVLTFKKEDMSRLERGSVKSIRGLYEVGYWWSDGDHTEVLKVIECRQPVDGAL